MYLLADDTAGIAVKNELQQHIAICPSCQAEYEEMQLVFAALQPGISINAPLLLKQNIIQQLNKKEITMETVNKKRSILSPVVKRILAVAAIVTALVLVIPFFNSGSASGKAANSLFQNAIDATALVKNMKLTFSMRTEAKDNFDMVGKELPMVGHTIIKTFELPEKWRIEKAGRVVVCDGNNQYLWIPEMKQAQKGPANAGFINWVKVLLDPSNLLWKEKEEAKAKGSAVTIKEDDANQYVTIVSKAEGNFLNDYLKNKSINESDNRREYVFDKTTKLLKGLKIYLLEGKTATLIFSIDSIAYDTDISNDAFAINVPDGVEWQTINFDVVNESFSTISSKRAAELIFGALAKKDFESTKTVWTQFSSFSINSIEKNYGGLKVLRIGESFKSGLYPGEFVPYMIKLTDGSVRNAKLALRNDNKNKVWVVDGGI
jgi:outer membrane lipoprotein-sorting protein